MKRLEDTESTEVNDTTYNLDDFSDDFADVDSSKGGVPLRITNRKSGMLIKLGRQLASYLELDDEDFGREGKGIAVYPSVANRKILVRKVTSSTPDNKVRHISGDTNMVLLYNSKLAKHLLMLAGVKLEMNKTIQFNKIDCSNDSKGNKVVVIDLTDPTGDSKAFRQVV